MKAQSLWTRDFTILTIGSAISLLGHSVASFALSLLVLDYTGSTLLYSIYLVCYHLPQVITPLLAGPLLDRMSRKKAIYCLDFLGAGVYLVLFLLVSSGFFHYLLLLAVVLLIGAVDGAYLVAYDSLYPNLITEGNFGKAYSISSLLFSMSYLMLPAASLACQQFGCGALFGFNSAALLTAALFERTIGHEETHTVKHSGEKKSERLCLWREDFREGMAYLRSERGLLALSVYFFVTMLAGSGRDTLILPFFRNHMDLFPRIGLDGATLYSIIAAFIVLGELAGGALHYRVQYPPNRKFAIAMGVYLAVSALYMVSLYLPLGLMAGCFFVSGLLSVTSYNIRISATQSYVPDQKRARFNGCFQMISMLGSTLGQLAAGGLSTLLQERQIVLGLMAVNMGAVWLIVWPNRKEIGTVYGQTLSFRQK